MPQPTHLLWSVFRVLGFSLFGLLLLVSGCVVFSQHRLIYHPRPYEPGRIEQFGRRVETLVYRTDQGRQVAFYVPPRDPGRPEALWVLFAGNGSLALDWETLGRADRDRGRAFLLVDYPGYGQSAGRASPEGVRGSADAALAMLTARLGAVPPLLGAGGHSLGAAAALGFAAAHPEVSRVVLVSPFTSLRAMARREVGLPLAWLLRGNYDNVARLNELAARRAPAGPPRVWVLHGASDAFIPPAMGQMLAAAHPEFVRFESVPGAGHEDVLDAALPRLLEVLDGR